MQILNSSKQHVAVILLLELCLDLTSKITNAHVGENTLYNNMNETATLKYSMNESTTLQNMLEKTNLLNNITDSKTCDNCSLWTNVSKEVEENCSYSRGWNLKGSEWGCCGNYPGCCTFASFICFIHDALCKCCDVGGNFCGPTCKPEETCANRNNGQIRKKKCRDKIANFTNLKPESRGYVNVDTVEQALNNTENRNSTHRNYFLSGRAVSGTEENVLPDSGDCEEGSGEIDS